MELDRGERLHLRIGSHVVLVSVAAVLAPHDVFGSKRTYCSEDTDLFVARRFRIVAGWGIYREQHNDLQHVVLHDVANGAQLFIKAPAVFHAKTFAHGDLHALDVLTIPDWFQEGVREAEIE